MVSHWPVSRGLDVGCPHVLHLLGILPSSVTTSCNLSNGNLLKSASVHTVLQYIYDDHAARITNHSYEHCSTGRPYITAMIAPAAKLASTLQVSSHSQPSLLLWVFSLLG